jgi:hypothetical protein
MSRLTTSLLPLAILTLSTPLGAQQSDPDATARTRLNAEQAEAARRQVDANLASLRAYEEAVAAHDRAVQAYEAAVASQKAEAEKIQADYAAAVRKWEADVAACKKGQKAHCAPLPAK